MYGDIVTCELFVGVYFGTQNCFSGSRRYPPIITDKGLMTTLTKNGTTYEIPETQNAFQEVYLLEEASISM